MFFFSFFHLKKYYFFILLFISFYYVFQWLLNIWKAFKNSLVAHYKQLSKGCNKGAI